MKAFHLLNFRLLVSLATLLGTGAFTAAQLPPAAAKPVDFVQEVRPIFQKACYSCHGPEKQKSNYRLDQRAVALAGADLGERPILPGRSAESPLIQYVAGTHPDITMPPKGKRLSPEEVGLLRAWIDQGARWPAEANSAVEDKADWWSFKPIAQPAVPALSPDLSNPIDAFIRAALREKGLHPSPPADARTLIRRVTFDLTGLPPTPQEVEAFLADQSPDAYEKLVDRLLASPRYGERWGRHWLDVVHYGDTHGYDKDKVRPNSWPYRDYVIRAFNEDKPYSRFVQEQIAGDALFLDSPDGIIALGFLAAGPWDLVGQAELREGTLDKTITRNLDRDDMVSTTMNTFASVTVQCARCHNHKFDPVAQEDYYSLQAVFAAIDRADRPYDASPEIARRRRNLARRQGEIAANIEQQRRAAVAAAGPELKEIDSKIAALTRAKNASPGVRPEYGYHSAISSDQNAKKWVQVDLGASVSLDRIVIVGCHDDFNGIGDGFGFPLRFKIEICDDADFAHNVIVVTDQTSTDFANPGARPLNFPADHHTGRFIRVTATKLAPRQNDFNFALAELSAFTPVGENVALHKPVTSLDSVEAPVRWARANLVDGYYPHTDPAAAEAAGKIAELQTRRSALLEKSLTPAIRQTLARLESESSNLARELAALPKPAMVYAGATAFAPQGTFTPTHGKPRPVHLLYRGSEKEPRQEVKPGSFALRDVPQLPARFALSTTAGEGDRRIALARWLTDAHNPLVWRSIVNRVWQYHFGRGLVDTPNDFGHMGSKPTHPALLDYLAWQFRDGGDAIRTPQSIKSLHRLIVTSATYRQSSAHDEANAKVDASNQYLWRMNRNRLEAEAIWDATLSVSGQLNLKMGGPGFRAFGFRDDHSPHYGYNEHDPEDPASHRRSVYRFVVRSVPDPFLETLDCADSSQLVPRRNETLTALQALALMNNRFMLSMAGHFAQRLEADHLHDLDTQIDAACRLAYARPATPLEMQTLRTIAQRHGLPSACRLIFNSNEFIFID